MAINFPNTPTQGDTHDDPVSGLRYSYDGEKWLTTGSTPTFVKTSGDTMTGDLTAPVFIATDHMENVGAFNTATFANTEEEFTIPSWATRAKIVVRQGFGDGSNGQPFECRVKAGTGADYGTISGKSSITSWTGGGASITQSDDQTGVPYFRLTGPNGVAGPGASYTYRALGEISWRDTGAGIFNIVGNWSGVSFGDNNPLSGPASFWSNIAGNLTGAPGVISFVTTYAANTNNVDVIFYTN